MVREAGTKGKKHNGMGRPRWGKGGRNKMVWEGRSRKERGRNKMVRETKVGRRGKKYRRNTEAKRNGGSK